jgi:hypothetical protein
VWQYVEVVPTDSGSKPSTSSGPPGAVLTPGQQRRLDALGKSGRTLAAVVNDTAPLSLRGARRAHQGRRRAIAAGITRSGSGSGPGPGSSTAPAVAPNTGGPSGSPVGSVFSAAFGRGGLGYLLPAAIVATALAVGVRWMIRQRRRRAS